MPAATNPCATCYHFDRIVFGDGTRKPRHGWCAAKSIYPHAEQQGQVFPPGVKRAASGALASPVIVAADEAVPNCPYYRAR
jgi:hypothetical protein